jgi:Uma2 family endonuclease
LGVQTIGNAVRYPDALVTCTKFDLSDRLAPDVKIVFDVLSPSSGTLDRVTKLREYGGVPSILRYVIVEYESVGLQVMHRQKGGEEWRVLPLTEGQVLPLPEIGAEIPLSEIYEDVTFPEAPAL